MVASGGTVQVPIASVTKLMSALVILADHPLGVGAPGPDISITAADVANYQADKAADDSVVAVTRGEQLSELDALEAALVPSADNIIQLLATWDAGSTKAFVTRMNAEARRLGLTHTHYAGPSGVNPATVSTASDEVRVATAVMANPVLASIVAQPQVTLPVAGVQYNVNADLGRDGIVGVKTGWVPAGGASFVFAARHSVAGKSVLVVGAIVGDQQVPAIPTVLTDARRIAREAELAVSRRLVVTGGERVASLSDAGVTIPVEAARSASLLAWNGARVTQSVTFSPRVSLPVDPGTRVGTLDVALGDEHVTVPIVAGARLSSPSLSWRLVHG
jgi:D-alanyl-D-alanine carboxypeptidase (penicillin-binding protein 5/6)